MRRFVALPEGVCVDGTPAHGRGVLAESDRNPTTRARGPAPACHRREHQAGQLALLPNW